MQASHAVAISAIRIRASIKQRPHFRKVAEETRLREQLAQLGGLIIGRWYRQSSHQRDAGRTRERSETTAATAITGPRCRRGRLRRRTAHNLRRRTLLRGTSNVPRNCRLRGNRSATFWLRLRLRLLLPRRRGRRRLRRRLVWQRRRCTRPWSACCAVSVHPTDSWVEGA